MKSEDRRDGIMQWLLAEGQASVDDLAARFSVSKMTIHRDLDELEQSGFLRKVRGGATVQSSARFESDYRYRQKVAAEEKERIARAAAGLIEPGQTVILDDGSTSGRVAAHLLDLKPLTVITNNLGVISALAGETGVNLIALGGQYSKKFNGFFGLVTDAALASLSADIAFLTASAIQGAAAFHQEQEVVVTKRAMMHSAERSYLLVDHGKFDKRALHLFTPLSAFSGVLTGKPLAADAGRDLAESGARVVVAE
ncbi:DeoR/GlpR family transcriptional regulator of sugar metabolism [Rhizobium sp. SG_E_25_P2]|uniref:DeoR/GlpR family DNA-binding transcription regulator n=1 Tax=Rhizobium sp. SG_E_25_P2 TaxID=2879942 RepID=UPI0024749AEB|nr:DeoR/GlpR family DNA-binding transcription regulator [Rhizobium sp. SG_E_25_P2]MDH6269097.1 DeoR/GlpR family transcriptional regulator of sugar metabolism [Rhizobium sp. SG_E_25_P2]